MRDRARIRRLAIAALALCLTGCAAIVPPFSPPATPTPTSTPTPAPTPTPSIWPIGLHPVLPTEVREEIRRRLKGDPRWSLVGEGGDRPDRSRCGPRAVAPGDVDLRADGAFPHSDR